MNIFNRLKKLEKVTDNSTVCACHPQRFETYIQDLGEDAETNAPVLTSQPTPDICPDCGKPADRKSIVVQLCDLTTKDNFPDEWEKITDRIKGDTK
jgi:DNA repair exonuclease SbcCD ATPase subunit